jgi:DNA-binding MarR family transcriptional regulator
MVKSTADEAARILRLASRIHFQLGPAAQHWLGGGVHSSGEAALLANLVELGPKTVPELAAMRPTSRQFIQGLVDGMAARGLVTLTDNPNHKRSRLVALTAKGRALSGALMSKWRHAMERLIKNQDPQALNDCAEVLARILESLEETP